jgi:hypothetical protein
MAKDTQPVELMGSNVTQQTVIIANDASLSALIDLGGLTLVGIHMPALWTAANLTFQVSEDGITYDNLYDRFGNEIVYIAGAARVIILSPAEWVGIRFVKIRSGIAATPVNQGAARNIIAVSKVV